MRLVLPCLLAMTVWPGANDSIARAGDGELFAKENLVAWCIVPFDASKRTPEERATMLRELGLSRCAYDWRSEHVPTFEQEILAYQKYGIEFFAFWSQHETAFSLFEKYDLHPQIWQTAPSPKGDSDAERIMAAAGALTPLARRTRELDCPLGLYNHGGWGGEPANLVAVCSELRSRGFDHVGIVYNFHHGHDHIADWRDSLLLMRPNLLCLNINGMNEEAQPKILPVGDGQHEATMLRVIVETGYDGPIGVLDHRHDVDAKVALDANLTGLGRLAAEIRD